MNEHFGIMFFLLYRPRVSVSNMDAHAHSHTDSRKCLNRLRQNSGVVDNSQVFAAEAMSPSMECLCCMYVSLAVLNIVIALEAPVATNGHIWNARLGIAAGFHEPEAVPIELAFVSSAESLRQGFGKQPMPRTAWYPRKMRTRPVVADKLGDV